MNALILSVVATAALPPWVVKVSDPCADGTFNVGSGVIVGGGTGETLILTSAHCIRDGIGRPQICANGQCHPATVVHVDDSVELALLRIRSTPEKAIVIDDEPVKQGRQVDILGFGNGSHPCVVAATCVGYVNMTPTWLGMTPPVVDGISGGPCINAETGKLTGIVWGADGQYSMASHLNQIIDFMVEAGHGELVGVSPPLPDWAPKGGVAVSDLKVITRPREQIEPDAKPDTKPDKPDRVHAPAAADVLESWDKLGESRVAEAVASASKAARLAKLAAILGIPSGIGLGLSAMYLLLSFKRAREKPVPPRPTRRRKRPRPAQPQQERTVEYINQETVLEAPPKVSNHKITYQQPPQDDGLRRMRETMRDVGSEYPAFRNWVQIVEKAYSLKLSGEAKHG